MPRYSLRKHTATQRTITIGRDGKRRIEIDEAAFLRPPPCPASGLAAKDFVVFRSRVLRVFLFPPLSWLPLSRANIRWIALRVRPW